MEPLAAKYREWASFKGQWGLEAIGADVAYANLEALHGENAWPGSGVIIGFIDTGIETLHPMFAGKLVAEQLFLGATNETFTELDASGFSHGTAVASIAAGWPVTGRFAAQGVAWGADIAMFAIPLGTAPPIFHPISLEALAGQDPVMAELADDVLGWRDGVDILNMSFGFSGIIDNYSEEDLRDNFSATIDRLAQSDATEKTILVWAGGNVHGLPCEVSPSNPHCVDGTMDASSVSVNAGLAARFPELQGHTIAVVALQDGLSGVEIAEFSNRCGIAADFCIAAPGDDVFFAYFGDQGQGLAAGRGTSFAAPMVSGGLAIMKQLFRDQLANTELVARLLATADDSGRFADSAIYGRGMLDLGAATSPVGVLDVPMGSQAGGPGTLLQDTGMRLGAAFGDGFTRSLAGREIVALDTLGAPFWFDLGSFASAGAAPSVSARLHDFMAPASDASGSRTQDPGFPSGGLDSGHDESSNRWQFGFLKAPVDTDGGHLGLAGDSLAFTLTDNRILSGTAFTTAGEFARRPVSGASLALQPAGSPLGLHAGWMGERETLLGSTTEGAFGALASDAVYAGIRADVDFGAWRMSANAELGTADPAARGGLITEISPLTTTAFSLGASRPFAGDGMLRISISQPLRVEHGRASFSVPSGRTKAGDIVRTPVATDVAPSGRQIDIGARWHQPLDLGELRLGAVLTHEPGHSATEGLDLTLLSGWRWSF